MNSDGQHLSVAYLYEARHRVRVKQKKKGKKTLLPILTGTGHVTIHSWVCRRGEPVEVLMASVKVCDDDSRLPERAFDLEWEERVAREKAAKATNIEKSHEVAAE